VASNEAVSKRKALAILRNEGLDVPFIGVVLDNRSLCGQAVDGIPVFSLLAWGPSFQLLHESERVPREVYQECVDYPQRLREALRTHGINE